MPSCLHKKDARLIKIQILFFFIIVFPANVMADTCSCEKHSASASDGSCAVSETSSSCTITFDSSSSTTTMEREFLAEFVSDIVIVPNNIFGPELRLRIRSSDERGELSPAFATSFLLAFSRSLASPLNPNLIGDITLDRLNHEQIRDRGVNVARSVLADFGFEPDYFMNEIIKPAQSLFNATGCIEVLLGADDFRFFISAQRSVIYSECPTIEP